MASTLKYKEFIGSINYDHPSRLYYGSVRALDKAIEYEGETFDKLKKEFEKKVEEYLKPLSVGGEQ